MTRYCDACEGEFEESGSAWRHRDLRIGLAIILFTATLVFVAVAIAELSG